MVDPETPDSQPAPAAGSAPVSAAPPAPLSQNLSEPPVRPRPRELPQGFRAGLITAITVLLGFSLGFVRFWGFDADGDWSELSVLPGAMLFLAILLQIVALYRSLRLEDEEEGEYRKTVRWFIASAVMLVLGLMAAVWEVS